jgi:signal transduction histidine kinase
VVALALCGDLGSLNVPMVAFFVPPYSVARYEPQRRAIVGATLCVSTSVLVSPLSGADMTSWAFSLGMPMASWVTGRAVRARSLLATALAATAQRITDERDARERFAVAEERTRIARELQAVVINRVSEMVMRADVATRWLDGDPASAGLAMEAIETTGQEALADMRRVLGALRQSDAPAVLAPQPGIGQIPALLESSSRPTALRLEGEPGPLRASVDLGVYRIVEDAITARHGPDAPGDVVDVVVRFGQQDVELELDVTGRAPVSWPTTVMREWAALCGGFLSVDLAVSATAGRSASGAGPSERLRARFPRVLDELTA